MPPRRQGHDRKELGLLGDYVLSAPSGRTERRCGFGKYTWHRHFRVRTTPPRPKGRKGANGSLERRSSCPCFPRGEERAGTWCNTRLSGAAARTLGTRFHSHARPMIGPEGNHRTSSLLGLSMGGQRPGILLLKARRIQTQSQLICNDLMSESARHVLRPPVHTELVVAGQWRPFRDSKPAPPSFKCVQLACSCSLTHLLQSIVFLASKFLGARLRSTRHTITILCWQLTSVS